MTASRLQGLDEAAAKQVVATAQALGLGRIEQARGQLRQILQIYPDHPEVLRLHAGILSAQGEHRQALTAMQRAVELRPMDSLYHNTLGTTLAASGDFDGAIRALNRACELNPTLAIAWYNLGVMLIRCVRNEEAITALRRAVTLGANNMDAHALLADLLRVAGHAEESAVEYRKILSRQPNAGMAWWGLADLRTRQLTTSDIERMAAVLSGSGVADSDRIAIGFALAKAFDEQGHYNESLGSLKRANAIARLHRKWNAGAFTAMINAINQAFSPPVASTAPPDLGHEVMFIVGLPRSGTTLVEQILASHSEVEGAGELPDLSLVLGEETRRRGKPIAQWVPDATPDDWKRLGTRYLERTAYWRRSHSRFTDKLPANWMYIGAIRAMLPGAHIVVCRRDPLETCFSCYRQLLPEGSEYARTPEDIVAFWRDFDHTANMYASMHSTAMYTHQYEELVAAPETSIRNLLAACGLSFEEACLTFYDTEREVRSPSATQVRSPLNAQTARASQYGELLDPFRALLALPPYGG
jgi:tetratricopeptide (TPR) repeat protein